MRRIKRCHSWAMNRRDLRALAAEIAAVIDAHLPGEAEVDARARARLVARATRHLPAPGAPEGSMLWPPVYALRIAAALGVDRDVAVRFAAAGALFFAAADLADDVVDGDAADPAIGVNDVCRLLLLTQSALLGLEGVPPGTRMALASFFSAQGQTMARGQELDLRGTGALEAADPVEIAALKSGAEFALFAAGPALLAGVDPKPYEAFGRAFGCLGQTLSDALDLFLDPTGDDWPARKPSFALRHGLDVSHRTGTLRELVAGACGRPDRRAAGLWHLVRLGAGERLAQIRDRCAAEMAEAAAAAGGGPTLLQLHEALVEWTSGVCDALQMFRDAAEPASASVEGARPRACAALGAFLTRPGALDELVRVHRWGFLDAPAVPDPRLSLLVVAELLASSSRPVPEAARGLVEGLPRNGWPRFDAVGAPPCTDTTARTLRLAAQLGMENDVAVQGAAEALRAQQRRDGLFPSWLGGPRDERCARFRARWGDGPCPAHSAWATLALWCVGLRKGAHLARAARGLSALFGQETTPASPFYGPLATDSAGGRALRAIRGVLDPKTRSAVDAALERIADRAEARLGLDGRMGDALETACGGWLLHHLGRLADPNPILRALIDDQAVDGGYEGCPFRRDWAPAGEVSWLGARTLTAAFVLRFFTAVAK